MFRKDSSFISIHMFIAGLQIRHVFAILIPKEYMSIMTVEIQIFSAFFIVHFNLTFLVQVYLFVS